MHVLKGAGGGDSFLYTDGSSRPINFPSKGQKVVILTNRGEVVGRRVTVTHQWLHSKKSMEGICLQ